MGAEATKLAIAKLLAVTASVMVLIPFHAHANEEGGFQSAREFTQWDWEQQQKLKESRRAIQPKGHRAVQIDDGDMPVQSFNPKKHASRRSGNDDMPPILDAPAPRPASGPVRGVKRVMPTIVNDDQPVAPPTAPQPTSAPVRGVKRVTPTSVNDDPPAAPPTVPQPTSAPIRGVKRVAPVVIDDTPVAPAAPVEAQPTAAIVKGKRLRDVIPDEAPVQPAAPVADPASGLTTLPKQVKGVKRVSGEAPVVVDPPAALPVAALAPLPVPTEPAPVPAVRGTKRVVATTATSIEAPAPQTVMAPVHPTETAATVATPAACSAGLTAPATGVAGTQKFGSEMRQALAQVTPPSPEDEEGNEYIEGYKEVSRQRGKPTAGSEKPKNAFVANLLKFAKQEVKKDKRMTKRGLQTRRRPNQPLGMCLQGVRMAFQKAAGESTAKGWGGTGNAKDAGPYLKNYGYKKIAITDAKSAPPGAVFIYVKPGAPHYAGHIEIKGTDGFYSDFYAPNEASKYMNRQLTEVWVPN